jgi:threonine dehydrogenase-like Zn-dependent dehydrogenase
MMIYFGKHPRAKAPLILGHEFSGYIASKHPILPEGTLVTVYPHIYCGKCEVCLAGASNVCLTIKVIGVDLDGGMVDYVLVPLDAVYKTPENVSPKLAAFIEPISVSVHAMRQGGYRPGDGVVVFGAGPIGMATALTLRQYGAGDLVIVEPNATRLEIAKSLDFDTIPFGADTRNDIHSRMHGGGDCVFDCAGHQSVIDILPDVTHINGKIVIVAGYNNPPQMDFYKCVMKQLAIQFVRNCARRDFVIACELTGRESSYEKLINYVFPATDAQKGFDLLSKPNDAAKVMFAFNDTV